MTMQNGVGGVGALGSVGAVRGGSPMQQHSSQGLHEYTGWHPEANASLTRRISARGYGFDLSAGSRVKAWPSHGYMYLETRVGQHTLVTVGVTPDAVQFDLPQQAQTYAPASPDHFPSSRQGLRGVGALSFGFGQPPHPIGLGIPGPWGASPQQSIDAGTYEITGTQVRLRAKPGTSQDEVSPGTTFNGAYGDNGGKVAGTPDQVDFAGTSAQNATANADGLKWAFVSVKSGALAGQKGFVAMEYMAPIGWTASHGGTGPAPSPQPQPSPSPAPDSGTTAAKTNIIPWIIGGLAVAGLVVGGAIMSKKGRRGGAHRPAHHAPAHAHEARRRRYRRR